MRSRYSAYSLRFSEYLLKTWFVTTRPQELTLDDNPDWCALDVVRASQLGNTGKVHFRAYYRLTDGARGCLEERSDFRRHNGQWYYHSGRII